MIETRKQLKEAIQDRDTLIATLRINGNMANKTPSKYNRKTIRPVGDIRLVLQEISDIQDYIIEENDRLKAYTETLENFADNLEVKVNSIRNSVVKMGGSIECLLYAVQEMQKNEG